ncbi:MAG: hypothetical protein JXQ91_07525 [Vannielia sp.]|uniref:hypothetical protein n=1 Tax=Vannielia sp. TaxID=2813045 RepID=UPI003B8E7350
MLKTPEEAREMGCPLARVHGDPAKNAKGLTGKCVADKCLLWRWAYTDIDFRWMSAMTREKALLQEPKKDDGKSKINERRADQIAAHRIAKAPDRYIIMEDDKDLGSCGLGGQG